MKSKSDIINSGISGITEVSHIIAIASGKGGVGKSTVSVNLALALQQMGCSVGLLDADLYGPSQPKMLGETLGDQGEMAIPKTEQDQLLPLEKYGVKFISMGVMKDGEQAAIMRAPLANRAIQQFLLGVFWGKLDYLLIDMPPGTGDIQLTITQQAQLTGAIIVTTPQEVAADIAWKGVGLFDAVNVPILGVIENMSGFTCSHCNQLTDIFMKDGGKNLAEELEVDFLGAIPLTPEIVRSGDQGVPLQIAYSELPAAKEMQKMAHDLHKKIIVLSQTISEQELSSINISPNKDQFTIAWKDGHTRTVNVYDLRLSCPCASCVDEVTGKKILENKKVSQKIKVIQLARVGHYGLSAQFSDGHSTGIYQLQHLKEQRI